MFYDSDGQNDPTPFNVAHSNWHRVVIKQGSYFNTFYVKPPSISNTYPLNSSPDFAINVDDDSLTSDKNFCYPSWRSIYSNTHPAGWNPSWNDAPLLVTITGPRFFSSKGLGTWTANATDDFGGYTYLWQFKNGTNPDPNVGWSNAGSNQSHTRMMFNSSFQLRCKVTSGYGGVNTTVSMTVIYGIDKAGSTVENVIFSNTLEQNYPNPFNASTKIGYSLTEPSYVQISIYDILGNEMMQLVNEERGEGTHQVTLNAENLSSGIYFYTIKTNSFIDTKRFTLMK